MPLRILLADDSMTAQKMGKDILTSAGFEVTTVSNGAAAAKKLADKHDIYIFDIFMPGYSGLELCEKVRTSVHAAKTPILLTVGKMEPFSQADVQRARADGVIIKPFEATDLLAAIKKLADAKAAADASYEKTMIFMPPQVQEFKDQSPAEPEAHDHPELHPAPPPPLVVPQEFASAPAFMMHEPEPAADAPTTPSPASSDSVGFAPAPLAMTATAAAAPAPDFNMEFPGAMPASELTQVETTSVENLLSAASATVGFGMLPIMEEVSPAPPEPAAGQHEVEFNSAPKAGHVQVTQEEGLEAESRDTEPVIAQDPALVTDPTQIATEFVTKFGSESSEIDEGDKGFADSGPASAQTESAAAGDDFESRVAAAMSGYGEATPQVTQTAPAETTPTVTPADDRHVESIATYSPARRDPSVDDTQEIAAVVEETPGNVPEPIQPSPGMQYATVVEEMQTVFEKLHTEAAAEPVPEPPASMSAEAPVVGDSSTATNAMDSQTTAQVVHRVLERMLPTIMAEVAKELDASKKS